MTEENAIEIADAVISSEFPDLTDATKTVQSYVSKDKEFYEVTYTDNVEAESDGGIIQLLRIVIVTIDSNTGEYFMAVSD